jgi:hypothetical protein
MPYIKWLHRERLSKILEALNDKPPQTAGELNYLVTMICRKYLEVFGKSYQTMNDIVGALECAKLELNRRVIGPYEDEKIAENGDVT